MPNYVFRAFEATQEIFEIVMEAERAHAKYINVESGEVVKFFIKPDPKGKTKFTYQCKYEDWTVPELFGIQTVTVLLVWTQYGGVYYGNGLFFKREEVP